MTQVAVHALIGRSVVEPVFQRRLLEGGISREELKEVQSGLDDTDLTAVILASLSTTNFPSFADYMSRYLKGQYGTSGSPSWDKADVSR